MKTRIAKGTQSPPGGGLSGYREMPGAAEDPIRNPDGMFSGLTRRSAMADGAHVIVDGLPEHFSRVKRRRGA